jgi:hypothetical protein
MLFGLELSRSGIGRRGEEPLCLSADMNNLYCCTRSCGQSNAVRGDEGLFVCLFVCCVCKPSGKTRAAGRKEGQLAARFFLMSKPSGRTRAEGKKDSSRRDIAVYE